MTGPEGVTQFGKVARQTYEFYLVASGSFRGLPTSFPRCLTNLMIECEIGTACFENKVGCEENMSLQVFCFVLFLTARVQPCVTRLSRKIHCRVELKVVCMSHESSGGLLQLYKCWQTPPPLPHSSRGLQNTQSFFQSFFNQKDENPERKPKNKQTEVLEA